MDLSTVRGWIEANVDETFTRASGPGGQHVNKTSTAIVFRLDLGRLEGISTEERARLLERLAGRVNEAGELVIRVQDSRSQAHNRVLARERAMALLVQALHREKPRRATKPTRASRERRLEAKRKTAGRKAGRRPHADD